MKTILISGSNGFIANNFIAQYSKDFKFVCLSHNRSANHYTIEELTTKPEIFESIDIILNLAGANIGARRWTKTRKQELLQSRIVTTTTLVDNFNKYNPKAHFISASAVGIYDQGIKNDDTTDIDYQKQENFSQEITKNWELAALKYQGPLTITRFGVVLSDKGGAFQEMLRPFLFGFGGKLGDGSQYFPWIALPDLLKALNQIIQKQSYGTYNLVAPNAITNSELSTQIAKVWQRPNWCHLPPLMIKSIFGQLGQELFLNSLYVAPTKLLNENFQFDYPDINSCLEAIHNNKI